jgi:hypothetical protein
MSADEITQRSVKWILDNFGKLSDLSKAEALVVWVTVYRAMEVTAQAEQAGGPTGITKDVLTGGDLGLRLGLAVANIDFLKKAIPVLRKTKNPANSAMLIEMLKYGNQEALNQSVFRRLIARLRATVDPMYSAPIPAVLYQR